MRVCVYADSYRGLGSGSGLTHVSRFAAFLLVAIQKEEV